MPDHSDPSSDKNAPPARDLSHLLPHDASSRTTVTPQEFEKILEEHRKFWDTKGQEGRNANLHDVYLGPDIEVSNPFLRNAVFRNVTIDQSKLPGASLHESTFHSSFIYNANLEGAQLFDSELTGAKLRETNLRGAALVRAKLTGAHLPEADLRDANLQDADLTGTTGLVAAQLAGANVSGARLPEDIKKFEGLEHIAELAKSARKLFIAMLLGCVYAWLTIATTTDVRLLTNSASTPLPIIQAPVPIANFFQWAPFILLAIYIWFHLYLQEMWKGLAGLPAVFPDGKPLDEKAYPWLLTGLVRPHFKLLRQNRPPLSRIKVGISIILAWWVVPFIFALFWLRYLPRHDWWGTGLHIVLLVVAVVCAIRFQHLAKLTLRGEQRESLWLKHRWRARAAYQGVLRRTWRISSVVVASLVMTMIVADGAINGIRPSEWFDPNTSTSPEDLDHLIWQSREIIRAEDYASLHRRLIPLYLPVLGFKAFADLTNAYVSTRPDNWFSRNEKVDLLDVVIGAQLRGADLRNASADWAFLVNADLRRAKLQNAHLLAADLRNADLSGAELQEADLESANLQEADLRRTHLEQAYLRGANLQNAVFGAAERQVGSSVAARARRMLGDALIERAFQTFLWKTDLRDADLTNAIGLTQSQLDNACVNEETKLPRGLKRPPPCPKIEFKFNLKKQ